MDKERTALVQKFIELLGFKTFEVMGLPGTRNWKGKTVYCIKVDGKFTFIVSSKMKYFDGRIREWMQTIESFNLRKNEMLQAIRKQVEKDNEEAKKENLLPVKVIDLKLNTTTYNDFMWFYVVLEVDGVQFKHIEKNLHEAIEGNTLNEQLQKRNAQRRHTAPWTNEPTYIFANIRFSHLDIWYKIRE